MEFFIVYIQEAHPSDGWQLPQNLDDDVVYAQPESDTQREEVASTCSLVLDLSIPTLLDDMDNSTDEAYAALPDRLYLIGRDGRIAFKGGPGPFGFRTKEFEAAIDEYLSSS